MPRWTERETGGGDASYEFSSAEPQPPAQEEKQNPELEGEPLPLNKIASQVELSLVRLRALLKEGKIEGDLRREGRGLGKWYTSIAAVRKYQENLWTPQEWGRKGGLIAGRGRPKSSKKSA